MGKKKATATDEPQTAADVQTDVAVADTPAEGAAPSVGLPPVLVIETLLLHPDEIVVDEGLNSRDSTGSVGELARDLLKDGQLEPIRVRRVGGDIHLVFGYRRHKAATLINEQALADPDQWPDGFKLRAEVVECNDGQCFAANVSENNGRKDLTLMEKVRSMDRLVTEFGWTQQEVADHFHVNRSNVSRSLKLLTAPRAIQKLIVNGKATAEAVLEALSMPEEEQGSAFEAIKEAAEGGEKATKTAARKKRKAKASKDGEGGEGQAESTTSKRLTLKEIRTFWQGVYDETLPEGADSTIQIVAGWVVKHMEGGLGDRALRSRLAGLKMGK